MPDITRPAPRPSRRAMFLGVLAALILGGGGFYGAYSGLFARTYDSTKFARSTLPDIAFLPLKPVIISLGPVGNATQLRMVAELEVARPDEGAVAVLMPRILDVINSYLRAVEVSQLQDPASLVWLRAQMLRRIQTVAGDGRVRDLLITEFILN